MISTDCNLHFIRHAETTFNQATEEFKVSNGNQDLNFDQLSDITEFRNEVRFHHSHIDCSITEKGKLECLRAKEHLRRSGIKPDLILVSPFNRTLQTCQRIFGIENDIPIIVQPLVGQILKSSCDLSHALENKKEKYHKYDFQDCFKLGNRWDLLKNSQGHLDHFRHILEKKDSDSHDQEIQMIIELLNDKDLVETQEHLLQRCERFFNKLKEVYTPKYKEIVVVTHFMFLNCVSATVYDKDCLPLDGIRPNNCEVHSVKFSQLLQKSKI